MIPISLLNLAGLIQADPPPFAKPPLPKIEIPKIDPLPPVVPEPLPKPPVSLLWRKLFGYVPVVRFYYAGQAIAEFLADARDMLDDAMALEAEKADHDNLLKGAETYRANLAESNDPEAEKKRQFEATCYWNCVDRNGADNCLKPPFVQGESKPKRDTFGEPVRKSDEEFTLTPSPATIQNGQTGIPRIVASADETPATPPASPSATAVATTSVDDDLSMPPSDWEAVKKQGTEKFIATVKRFSDWAKATVLRMIDGGSSGEEILAWRNDVLQVQLTRICDTCEISFETPDLLWPWHYAIVGASSLNVSCEHYALQPGGLQAIKSAILQAEPAPAVASEAEDQKNGSINGIFIEGLMSMIDLLKGMRAEGMSADLMGRTVSSASLLKLYGESLAEVRG